MNNLSLSPYLQSLTGNPKFYQSLIEGLLEKFQAQPVGYGYIDLILERESSIRLIEEFTKLPIAIARLTWWCHFTPETKLKFSCPHGMGGPINKFGEGFFSECVQFPDYAVAELPNSPDEFLLSPDNFAEECNKAVVNYIKNVLPFESFYSPCLYAGLWLNVPTDWKRKHYWV